MILALIPARGGSVRLPRKNLRTVAGQTLLARAITIAQQIPDALPLVSTDDTSIAREATAHGCWVHQRTPHEADGQQHRALVGILALEHAASRGPEPEAVVLLQPTSPLRSLTTVLAALKMFRETGCDTVVSVQPVRRYYAAGTLDQDSRLDTTSITLPSWTNPNPMFAPDGVVWVVRPETLRLHRDWYGPDTRAIISDPTESVDVDQELDLRIAEALAPHELEPAVYIRSGCRNRS